MLRSVLEYFDNLPAAAEFGDLRAGIHASQIAVGSADVAPEFYYKYPAGSLVWR